LPYVPDMTFDNFHLIVDLVTAGVGVGIVSWDVAEEAVRLEKVARVRIDSVDCLRRSIGLVRHAERAVDGALEAFCAEVDRATAG